MTENHGVGGSIPPMGTIIPPHNRTFESKISHLCKAELGIASPPCSQPGALNWVARAEVELGHASVPARGGNYAGTIAGTEIFRTQSILARSIT